MTRKAYIQTELVNGQYVTIATRPCCDSRIMATWRRCINITTKFRDNIVSVHLGYCDRNEGKILAFCKLK